ncbi:MAG: hypothetical protein J6Y80_07320 [Victivallales bacterium]|nr:hypothetical protein [Victivallales bacterium]
MNKRFGFALILCATLAWFGIQAANAEVDHSKSDARLAILEKLMGDALSANPGLEIPELVNATAQKFKATERCLQADKLPPLVSEDESRLKAAEAVAAAALVEYPDYNSQELQKKAAEIYPMYKEGQFVTVKFRKNAKLSETVRGIYMGIRGGNVIVNSRTIRLGDMEGILGNDGPDGEIVKYDQIANRRLRQEWIDSYISDSVVARKKFEDEHAQEFQDRQLAEDFLANQVNGYTFWDDQWFSPDALLQEFASNAIILKRSAIAREENLRRTRGNSEVASQQAMTSQSYAVAPIGKLPRVDGILAKQAEAERKKQELAAQQAKEAEELAEREAEEARQAELAAQRAANPETTRPATRTTPTTPAEPEQASNRLWLYVAIGVVALVVLALIIWQIFFRGEKELNVADFYKSKGEFQENFWNAAEADPDGFKYVAYLFNNVDEAKNALCQLSFVGMGVNGELKSKRGDIILGAYKHQDRAVAVIGGVTLNYARWREASMVWPELPNASYFRQSSEPKVKLVVPSPEELSRQEGLNVEKLGAEDVRTESGEINRVFRYRCDSREAALRFLALFKVEEEGIVVRVETPEGEFGKDLNGVFTV